MFYPWGVTAATALTMAAAALDGGCRLGVWESLLPPRHYAWAMRLSSRFSGFSCPCQVPHFIASDNNLVGRNQLCTPLDSPIQDEDQEQQNDQIPQEFMFEAGGAANRDNSSSRAAQRLMPLGRCPGHWLRVLRAVSLLFPGEGAAATASVLLLFSVGAFPPSWEAHAKTCAALQRACFRAQHSQGAGAGG